MSRLLDAVEAVVEHLPSAELEGLASAVAEGRRAVRVGSEAQPAVDGFLGVVSDEGVAADLAAAYLRGAAVGARAAERPRVQVVWSGPRTHAVPTRSTAEVLVQLIDRAARELVLVTYSARRYEPIVDALVLAVARGVTVTVVVETLQGAGSALAGREPAAAFLEVPGVRLWHWPAGQREHPSAKMHAKLAIADRRELFVSSVNLTASGVEHSIEAGLLVTGGSAPRRAAEHIAELQAGGVLVPLPR